MEKMFWRLPDNKHQTGHRSVDQEDTFSALEIYSRLPTRSIGKEFSGKRPVDCVFRPFS